MDLYILNKRFEAVDVIDSYISFIWTDRYWQAGDFELYVPATYDNLMKYPPDYYIWNRDSEHMMIIEDIETKYDADEGDTLVITGRSLESLLERRIIWAQTQVSGSFQGAVKTLVTKNIVSTANGGTASADRAISNFLFEDSTQPGVTTPVIDKGQYFTDNLYDVLTKMCEDKKLGFKVTLNASNQFVFKLYDGEDRTYNQIVNPVVIFSPSFQNMLSGEYKEIMSGYKNVALIGGEGGGNSKKTDTVGDGQIDIDRREVYIDANNLSTSASGSTITTSVYKKQLQQKGYEELKKKYKLQKTFECEIETEQIFKYGVDYFMGDIVQLEDQFGRRRRTRVIEFVQNHDDSGYKAYPKFEVIDEE